MARQYNQLPRVAFSILLALCLRERHGYEIIKQVREDSSDKIKLSPGALYTSIKRLNEQGLVAEVDNVDLRRRYYRLTNQGRQALDAELAYYQNSLELARSRNLPVSEVRYA